MTRAHDWQANHFSVTDADNDTPSLLRKVATAINQLGNVEIHDITFCIGEGTEGNEATVTVYFSFSDDGDGDR
jgi:hypothetical protein